MKKETTKVNGFTQSMNDFDYNLVEQFLEEQNAEQQMFDEKVEEPAEAPVEPTTVEPQESPIVEEPTEEVVTEQATTSEVTPPFQADVSLDVAEEIFSALKKRPTAVVVKVRILDGIVLF